MYSNLYLAIIGFVFLFEQPAQHLTASFVGFDPFDRESAGYALHPLAIRVPAREWRNCKAVKCVVSSDRKSEIRSEVGGQR